MLHRVLQELGCGPAIPALGGETVECRAFAIHGAPKTARLAVDPDEHRVEVPSPMPIRSMMNAPLPDRAVRTHIRGRVVRIENVIHNLAVVPRRIHHPL